jgi:hypothetical protein
MDCWRPTNIDNHSIDPWHVAFPCKAQTEEHPGEYRVHLKVAASNCPPQDVTVKVKMPGEWFADEDRMFRDGIGLSLG